MKCGSDDELAVLQWSVRQAKQIAGATRVLLFGSRARGDADDRSDFDIAIETDSPDKLSELSALFEEHPLTLVAFDVVDLRSAPPYFQARILSEAKDITNI